MTVHSNQKGDIVDTLNTYLPDKTCQDCSKTGVEIIHFGDLITDEEYAKGIGSIHLCIPCFNARIGNKSLSSVTN
jgi:hypothetical protein